MAATARAWSPVLGKAQSLADGPCSSYCNSCVPPDDVSLRRSIRYAGFSRDRCGIMRRYSTEHATMFAVDRNSAVWRWSTVFSSQWMTSRAARQGDSEAETEQSSVRREASAERSESTNEELLLFLFQLDLSVRLQRALNNELYEAAQQLREKIAEVEQEVGRQREAKTGTVSPKDEAQDTALTVLRLKADLQKAIQGEDYAGAVRIRDQISRLESESLAASARALAYQNLKYNFRLGQRVKHKIYGYQGIVCGMDPRCCESKEWSEGAGVEHLTRGKYQPFTKFYFLGVSVVEDLILVDVHQEPSLMVTYVAEDSLCTPERGEIGRFDHPYTYFLFYGADSMGDFIPSKQLREKYNAPRHEVPYDEDDSPSGKAP